jgi:hypothetical protein
VVSFRNPQCHTLFRGYDGLGETSIEAALADFFLRFGAKEAGKGTWFHLPIHIGQFIFVHHNF